MDTYDLYSIFLANQIQEQIDEEKNRNKEEDDE